MSKQEESTLVKLALGMGAWLTPDIDYAEPKPLRIHTYNQYEAYRKQTRLLFILHSSFVVAPLEMRRIEKGGRTVFFVMQRNGGPTIDFLSTVEYEEDGRACVNPGEIAHYKTFWNPKSQANEEPPEALTIFFRELTGAIKKAAVRTKVGVRTYWIGREMAAMIDSGAKHLGIRVRTANKNNA